MTPDVINVRSLPDYELLVAIEDGEQRLFSVKLFLRFPASQPLVEPSRFMAAHVFNGTVAWLGDLDISPDTLYIAGERLNPSNF